MTYRFFNYAEFFYFVRDASANPDPQWNFCPWMTRPEQMRKKIPTHKLMQILKKNLALHENVKGWNKANEMWTVFNKCDWDEVKYKFVVQADARLTTASSDS